MIEYTVRVHSNGDKYWLNKDGEQHREDGPAVEYSTGDKFWYINNKLHRIDGPAVEGSNGSKKWCINGELHREDGPAVEWFDGTKFWWINGERLTEEEFNKRTQTKKLTVAEISELLGYDVEVVKE